MMKKRILSLLAVLMLILPGCSKDRSHAAIVCTTLPVYDFTTFLCQGTDLSVSRLVTENVSCLHDYTLRVEQMQAVERAQVVVLSGAGLEGFLDDALHKAQQVIDASHGIAPEEHHSHEHGHSHDFDPHIWLSPTKAKVMAQNICRELMILYPQHQAAFRQNLTALEGKLDALQAYGEEALSSLSCRELITFHDGFGYFADSFDLTVLKAVEEESGSEASAQTMINLIGLVRRHDLPAIFVETNGADSAASVIAAEANAKVFVLDMAMAGDSYFESMYQNIDIVREALQ